MLGFFISPADELPDGETDYVLIDNVVVYKP
jgi:hypothetical protein